MKDKDILRLAAVNAAVDKNKLRNRILSSTDKPTIYKSIYRYIPVAASVFIIIIISLAVILPKIQPKVTPIEQYAVSNTEDEKKFENFNIDSIPEDGKFSITDTLSKAFINDSKKQYKINAEIYSKDFDEYMENYRHDGRMLSELYAEYNNANKNGNTESERLYKNWQKAYNEALKGYFTDEQKYFESIGIEVIDYSFDNRTIVIQANSKQISGIKLPEGKAFIFDLQKS